jgi:2-isopropylmalate synthase
MKFLREVIESAIDAGADIINVPDTVGVRDPFYMLKFYDQILRFVHEVNPNTIVSAHNHNDLGHAVSNTLALVHAAIQLCRETGRQINVQLEGTVCGVGERAGNADIFPVAASIFDLARNVTDIPLTWEFNPRASHGVAQDVMQTFREDVPRRSPIVGEGINQHFSGIHSDGVTKGGWQLYTAINPTFWGHLSEYVAGTGKYSGKKKG